MSKPDWTILRKVAEAFGVSWFFSIKLEYEQTKSERFFTYW